MFILLIFITAIPAYLLGSINGAIIASKIFYRKDIRDFGSGNPGLTNFYRTFGKSGVLLVIFIDVLKTILPVIFGGWLFAQYTDMALSDILWFDRFFNEALFGQVLAGFCAVLGHCYPVFYKFKGGKGVLAFGAFLLVIDWRLALISWGVFIIITIITRYVSLGAILGSVALPTSVFFLQIGGRAELNIVTMCTVLVIVRHIPNIKRLVKGEESKLKFTRSKE